MLQTRSSSAWSSFGSWPLRAVKLVALIWPVWVSFCLVLSANHFLVDIVVGAFVAVVVGLVVALAQHLSRASGRRPGDASLGW